MNTKIQFITLHLTLILLHLLHLDIYIYTLNLLHYLLHYILNIIYYSRPLYIIYYLYIQINCFYLKRYTGIGLATGEGAPDPLFGMGPAVRFVQNL